MNALPRILRAGLLGLTVTLIAAPALPAAPQGSARDARIDRGVGREGERRAERGARRTDQETSAEHDRAALRERWEALSPERRDELRRRYEALQKLSAGEREALVARARELTRIEESLVQELGADERAALDALTAPQRRQVLRELSADRARERAERLREALSAERRQELESLDPAGRRRLFDELRRGQDKDLPRHLRELGAEVGLGPRELAELEGLPREEQKARVFELVRRRAERWIEQRGLPEGVSAEQWSRLRELPPDRFARRLVRMRDHAPELRRRGAGPPPGGARPGRGPGGPGGRRPGGARPGGGPPEGPPPDGGPPPGGGPPRGGGPPSRDPADDLVASDVERDVLRLVREAAAVPPGERIRLAGLDPRERERRIGDGRRARVLEVLAGQGVQEPALEALRGLPMHRFHRALREVIRRLGRGESVDALPEPRR